LSKTIEKSSFQAIQHS